MLLPALLVGPCPLRHRAVYVCTKDVSWRCSVPSATQRVPSLHPPDPKHPKTASCTLHRGPSNSSLPPPHPFNLCFLQLPSQPVQSRPPPLPPCLAYPPSRLLHKAVANFLPRNPGFDIQNTRVRCQNTHPQLKAQRVDCAHSLSKSGTYQVPDVQYTLDLCCKPLLHHPLSKNFLESLAVFWKTPFLAREFYACSHVPL